MIPDVDAFGAKAHAPFRRGLLGGLGLKTLAVMSRKGGAGKTTVAVNLALAARSMGVKAVLADADPLRSACEVLRGRDEAAGLLFETSASKLFTLTEACRRAGAQLLIIDTPAAPEADVAEAVKVADFCLAVARPTYLDLAAAVQSVAIIQRLGTEGMIVLNQCPTPRNGVEPPSVVKALEALRFASLPVIPAVLRSRLIYQTAFAQGRSVLEIDGDGAASAEVRDLLVHVWRIMTGQASPPLRTANDDLKRPAARTASLALRRA
jgi:chromosome partitioning protein